MNAGLPLERGNPALVIQGVGSHLPERRVSTEELARRYSVDPGPLVSSTGIEERRFAQLGVGTADLGARATLDALSHCALSPGDIDLIIFCTLSPEHMFPGSGYYMQRLIGASTSTTPVLDLRCQCSGFIHGLVMAEALLTSRRYHRIALVCAEVQSRIVEDPATPPGVAVLFGDGAGAVILESGSREDSGSRRFAFNLGADGSGAESLRLELFDIRKSPYIDQEMLANASHVPQMDGQAVFLRAVQEMTDSCKKVMSDAGVTPDAIRLVIPHQANGRILEMVRRRLGLKEDQLFCNIRLRGNTTSASIPIALHEAIEEERIKRGDLVLFTAFGSGFSWGSVLMEY